MKQINVTQGSQEWLDLRVNHFGASEAPMMMGDHKQVSRTQLLDNKKGWNSIVEDYLQKIFDKGHEAEELARPLAEQIVDDEFYPVTGILEVDGVNLLASFDGLTMMDDIVFEHKLYNKVLAENVLNEVLEPHHYWQLEQQLLVSGAEKALFVTSDGTESKRQHMFYVSVPERREALIKGWKQFSIDLETHKPQAKTEVVKAATTEALPLIEYEMNGMALTSNLDVFEARSLELVEQSSEVMETDQDFANAEAMQKDFAQAEKDIKAIQEKVLTEVADISSFTKSLKRIGENIRQARLAQGKQIKSRKEEIRGGIHLKAQGEIDAFWFAAKEKVNAALPQLSVNVAEAMKNKRTIDSLQDAADGAVAKAKIEIDNYVSIATDNMLVIADNRDYDFLFSDWSQIAFKASDDFKALVAMRIGEHKQREAERESQIKAKAEQEALRKAEAARQAEIKAEAEAKARAEEQRVLAEQAEIRKQEQAKHEAAQEVEPVPQQNKPTSSANEIQGFMQHPSKSKSVEQSVSRMITEIEVAYMAGFMAGYHQPEALINPEKEAADLASKYSESEAAA